MSDVTGTSQFRCLPHILNAIDTINPAKPFNNLQGIDMCLRHSAQQTWTLPPSTLPLHGEKVSGKGMMCAATI